MVAVLGQEEQEPGEGVDLWIPRILLLEVSSELESLCFQGV